MHTREVLRLAQPNARSFAPGLIFGLLSATSAVALIAASAYLITRAADQPPILYLSIAIVGVRAFALARASFRYLERLTGHNATFQGLATLRAAIFERLVPLAPDGLRGPRRGDLLTRLVGDVDELQNLPLRVVQPLLISALVSVAAVVGVTLLLPAAGVALAVALVVAFALGTVVNLALGDRAARRASSVRADFADQTLDFVGSLDVLTAFGATERRLDRLSATELQLRGVALGTARSAGATAAVVSLIAGLTTVVAMVLGIAALGIGPVLSGAASGVAGAAAAGAGDSGALVLAGGAISGPALAMLALIPMALFEVVGMVPLAAGALRAVSVSAARVAHAVPDVVPAEIPVEIPVQMGSGPVVSSAVELAAEGVPTIELTGLGARWPESGSEVDALRGVRLSIRPGERVLVTGESGSGKTTLAHVLVRFLQYSGSFTIDGVEARTLSPASVRSTIGLCEQNPYIFDANLRQNLLFARETATDDELLEVLERVGLKEWALERGGLSTTLGEHGAQVSGGQAQRIALARVLLAGFSVVVFDEPTANVDPTQSDRLIADLLAAAGPSRSVVLISHTEVPPGLITQTLRLG